MFAKVTLGEQEAPVQFSRVHVTPKPIKTQYSQTRRLLNQFAKHPENYEGLYSIINNNEDLEFRPDFAGKQKMVHGVNRMNLWSFERELNKEQVL